MEMWELKRNRKIAIILIAYISIMMIIPFFTSKSLLDYTELSYLLSNGEDFDEIHLTSETTHKPKWAYPTNGDVLTVASKVTNIRERQGQMGRTAFITFSTTYNNQKQELVAECRQMIISY